MALEPLRLSPRLHPGRPGQRSILNPVSCLFAIFALVVSVQAEPITHPYLQDLTPHSATLRWVDTDPKPVQVTWGRSNTWSVSRPAPELGFAENEKTEHPGLREAPPRYLHQARLSRLGAGKTIRYSVALSPTPFSESFQTPTTNPRRVRVIAYSDSETEPESTGKPTPWASVDDPKRVYLVDQTEGYAANLQAIRQRSPDAVLVAGDLVESGGEQRDWDEFWRHNQGLAGSIPIWPAPGNHEYFAGPQAGRFEDQASRRAIAKYRSYFEGTSHPGYYQKTLGPLTAISLDSCDSMPHGSDSDSNHHLQAAGRFAPGFGPDSSQRVWLEGVLAAAQAKGQFIVVFFHHCPYSSGPHSFPPGKGSGYDPQSGVPLRELTPIFLKYGVAVLVTGHDEMFERSEVDGVEELPNGSTRPHRLHVYDVGVGGDGLRAADNDNPWRKFLAQEAAPEVWQDGELVSGGRHYGHLEMEIERTAKGWRATLTPVYLFPRKSPQGWTFERRVYPDVIELP